MSGTEEVPAGWWHRYGRAVAAGLAGLIGLALLALGPAGFALGVGDQLRRRAEVAAATQAMVGTEVRDGPVSFVVHSVHCGVVEEAPNGQLCEVTIAARNDGAEELVVPGPAQLLHGSAGARLRPAIEDPAPFGKLGPGQAATATIPFDVPSESVISHVEVHATPYTRGQVVALGGPPLPLLSTTDRPTGRSLLGSDADQSD